MHPAARRTDLRPLDILLCLAGVAGIAAGITLLVLDSQALMDLGGFCAEGGPYVIATHCPENSDLIFLLGFLGGGAAIVLASWKSSALGLGAGTVFLLAFAAVFGVIGLETVLAGFDPPGDEPGWAWGWLVMGTIFVAAAAVPLLLVVLAARSRAPDAEAAGSDVPPAADDVSRDIAAGVEVVAREKEAARGGPSAGLVDDLERLADLHDRGSLTDGEYARAKDGLMARGEDRDAAGGSAAVPGDVR